MKNNFEKVRERLFTTDEMLSFADYCLNGISNRHLCSGEEHLSVWIKLNSKKQEKWKT